MNETLTHYGIGVVIVILVLREVLPWAASLVKSNSNQAKPTGCVTRDEFEKHKQVAQYKDNCGEIVKRIEGEFRAIEDRDIRRVKVVDENFKNMREEFKEVKILIRNGG